jgi:dephospho-CoA kinase
MGGIASGKSFWAKIFSDLGCLIIDADQLVSDTYRDPAILTQLQSWWGPTILHPDGTLDRAAVARIIFTDPAQRHRLESLIHPEVHRRREEIMHHAATLSPRPRAAVWDIPLLLETGLHTLCDALVFIDTPLDIRIQRARLRGWDASELAKRQAAQAPLTDKQRLAHLTLPGTAQPATPELDHAIDQIKSLLTHLAPPPATPTP